jgi:restriction system protein
MILMSNASNSLINTLQTFWYIWAILLVFLLFSVINKVNKISKIIKAGLPKLDLMSKGDFEFFIKDLFEKKGYKVENAEQTVDYGADFILTKDNRKTVVTTILLKGGVQVQPVQELLGSKAFYTADEAMVITNSWFTNNATAYATANNIKLVDRQKLAELILTK